MIRTLAIIAAAGFVLCIGALSAAIAFAGGPSGLHDRFSQITKEMDLSIDSDDGSEIILGDSGPRATRKLAWDGTDTLDIDAFADVTYVQGPARSVSLEGPAALLDRITVKDGQIDFDGSRWKGGALKVVIEAPGVTRFDMGGVQDLKITGYDQDTLEISLSGAGRVTASGKARKASLDISGTGAANLAALEIEEAEAFSNFDVALPFVIKWRSPRTNSFIMIRRISIRNRRVRHVGKAQQGVALFCF